MEYDLSDPNWHEKALADQAMEKEKKRRINATIRALAGAKVESFDEDGNFVATFNKISK